MRVPTVGDRQRDYEVSLSSMHRHRKNCLKLGSSNAIMKEAARGSAAVALLPSKETLSGAYFELLHRADQIIAKAQEQRSLTVAISGLESIRQTLHSLARLAGLTVDGWIVADEAAHLTAEMIAALRPMRARRPQARFAVLSAAYGRTDPFWTAWAGENPNGSGSRRRSMPIPPPMRKNSSRANGPHSASRCSNREHLGIPGGGEASPFAWDLYERAINSLMSSNLGPPPGALPPTTAVDRSRVPARTAMPLQPLSPGPFHRAMSHLSCDLLGSYSGDHMLYPANDRAMGSMTTC
jgi:hypothetical protein